MIEYKDRLLDAMKETNTSVTALAKELGVSYQAVKKVVDGGTTAFSAANNSRAAQALKIKSHWLATGEGERNQGERDPGWTPKTEPEYLKVLSDDLEKTEPVPGYSDEALTLAWLLDQVQDRLHKKMAEVEASAAILRYVNQSAATPTDKQDEH